MSGGTWEYCGSRILVALEKIAEDSTVKERWPRVGELFVELATALYDAERDMDWDIAGDSSIKDDTAFEERVVGEILEAAMKVAPDAWFPRGKWATIQAVQARKGDEK